MVWMISANGNIYDHASSFATNGFIDWRQRAKYDIDDVVYIYCTRPLKRIMYKCKVVKQAMPFADCIDDRNFWLDISEYEKSKGGLYARLKLLEQVDTEFLSLELLTAHGLSSAPQGPIKVSSELSAYIDRYFNDFYAEGFFNDVDENRNFYEGHVKRVMIDVYERSSIARGRCIEYHGVNCQICGMNFGERYGKLGDGFIHVHHLRPLHLIKKDYVVDYKKDLIPVCPNCHAMIHRIPGGETMALDQLKAVLSKRESSNLLHTQTAKSAIVKEQIPNHLKQLTADINCDHLSKETYVDRRVIHTSEKFGAGVVKTETDTTVSITFDNGVSATFTQEAFAKGLLKLE